MARPIAEKADRRDERLNLRLTSADRIAIEANAAFVGLTPSEYARRRALDHRMPVSRADRQFKDRMQALLLKAGNNLNQIARHANAGRGLPADLADAIAHLEAVLVQLDDYAADEGGQGVQGRGPVLSA